MIVLVRGAGFHNQGAALMLHAVVAHYRRRGSDVLLAMPHQGAYVDRARLGLLQLLPPFRLGRSTLASSLMSKSFRRAFGLVREHEIEAVLDVSGFAYSDSWGADPLADAVRRSRRWRRRGTRVVLLPQALGPFTGDSMAARFRDLVSSIDLCFARDRVSHAHAVESGADARKLRMAPDFTLSVTPPEPVVEKLTFDGVTVVPNVRMLDKTEPQVARCYLASLVDGVRRLQTHDVPVRIVAHGKDVPVTVAALDQSGLSVPLLQEHDALAWKAAIVGSRVVLASRYHALVSALSSAVPAVGIGWSHKYDELFRDYGVPEWCLPGDASGEVIHATLEKLLEPSVHRELAAGLARRSATVRTSVDAMWREVDLTLGVL